MGRAEVARSEVVRAESSPLRSGPRRWDEPRVACAAQCEKQADILDFNFDSDLIGVQSANEEIYAALFHRADRC